ncbi:MAG: inosine monophosphate cyclohydrolase [Clostridia bacterium]|nr:inosine monophosphate cyclohydrolase [Clostridia bacterium]
MNKKSLPEMLKSNPYPGRSIAIGASADGLHGIIVYFIMGRSENSRNRIFVKRGDEVVILPYDEEKVEDPSLIIYSPVKVCNAGNKRFTIVTNGDQTETIYNALRNGKNFESALKTRCFEPDAPNYTPRISGMLSESDEGAHEYVLSILKSGDSIGSACVREFFNYALIPGTGHFISTYVTDGSPLPSFEGEPIPIDIPNDIHAFAEDIWSHLDNQNKIALYVRSIRLDTGRTESILINKHTEME